MAFNLEMVFGPKWENVSIIRHFLTEMLSAGIVDINDAKKVAIASAELVENVVKYSMFGGAIIAISKDLPAGRISLTLKNVTSPSHIQTFETIYQAVIDGDPKEIYKKMMLRSFSDPNTSQLGLARIRYECQGKISYRVSDHIDTVAGISGPLPDDEDLKLLSVAVEIPVRLIGS